MVHVPDGPVLGIDVGGTWIRSALVDGDGSIRRRERVRTPRSGGKAIVDALADIVGRAGNVDVGVGIAGLVSASGEVLTSPNLDIRGFALAEHLAARIGHFVPVANDASVAALAEQRFGAGRGVDDLVLITVGTGVGGGLVVGGELHLGANGFAGEIGHVRVEQSGRLCGCGGHGCLEAYASGSAIAEIGAERAAAGDVATVLGSSSALTTEDVVAAAAAGDQLAIEVLQEAARWLGLAAAIVANLLDPSVILIGGGAGTAAAPWLIPHASRVMRDHTLGGSRRAAVHMDVAVLGDDAGVIGAATLAAPHLGTRSPTDDVRGPRP